MAMERQSSTLPPVQPSYILRGHTSQIHSTQFIRQNSRLITGDADGWIVYWKLETKRSLAVWKAHDGAILGTAEWGRDRIVTHGRDNTLRIWQLRPSDEMVLSATLPAEVSTIERPKPWLLHTLPVNTLNFCAFSMCIADSAEHYDDTSQIAHNHSILIAVPGRDDQKVEVYQFPEERLKFMVPRVHGKDNGMAMAVKLVQEHSSNGFLVMTGYEGGMTAVHRLPQPSNSSISTAELIYTSKPHTQPVLSLDVSPGGKTYYTSSADAVIAAHRIPQPAPAIPSAQSQRTHQANSHIEAPRGEDLPSEQTNAFAEADVSAASQLLASSATNNKETTELTFAETPIKTPTLSFSKQSLPSTSTPLARAGLSSLLSSSTPHTSAHKSSPHRPAQPITLSEPYKTTNTKHAGQQSLRVRSDGRLLVTGGWDNKVRIYSAKTLKEVAVLKWHKEGVYAVDLAEVLGSEDLAREEDEVGASWNGEAVRRETGLGKLQRQREEAMQVKHWVAAGAKDGKVSLWEVF